MTNLNVFILLAVAGGSLFLGVYMHEYTHADIAESYGCEAEINYIPTTEYFMSVDWSCPEQDLETVKRAKDQQVIAESVGYQVVFLYFLLGLVLVFNAIILNEVRRVGDEVVRNRGRREVYGDG